ncbi:MAG TPA: c-type cytochrome domain-containing protein [Pirellulaceae bacterium]|jgi:WD40 repeat protein
MLRYVFNSFAIVIVVATCASVAAQDAKPAAAAPRVTYDEHVRPIFREHCFSCHSADKQESGLQLDNYPKAMAGGSSGEVVLAGDLASSRLWALVSHSEEPKMPPRQDKLAAAKLELISKWIEQGAPENAGSKVVIKKSALAAIASVAVGKPEGPAAMPVSLVKQPVVYTKRPGQITALAASPWAPLVAVAGQKQVILYSSESGELLGIVPFPEGTPQVVRFSRNGEVLLVAGGRGGQSGCVILYDVKSGKRIAKIGDELDAVLAADINAQQTLVALGGPNRVVRIYSAQTGELVNEIRKHTDWIYAVEFSPDGKSLATGDRSGGLFVWEADTARESLFLRGHTGGVTDIDWRGDSAIFATAGDDGTVKLWDINEGKAAKSWEAHKGGAFCVRFAHDGRLVSSGRDNTVKTWAADGAAQKSFPAFTEPALRCAFTHDDKTIVGGDWLGNVKLWTTADAKEARSLAANPPPIAIRLAAAQNDLKTKQAAAETATRNLADAKKAAAGKQKALAAATETQSALTTAITPLKQIKEPATEIKTALDSLAAAKSAADSAVEKITKENAAAQATRATAEQASKAAVAALDLAKRALASAEADQKAFAELPAKLSKAAAEAKESLEKLTAELAAAQAQAESAEAELKQFTQAYGGPNPPAASTASQVTASRPDAR